VTGAVSVKVDAEEALNDSDCECDGYLDSK